MASESIQRRIETLLDEADEAVANSDWAVVRDRAQNVLRLDPDNQDALSYLAAADRDTGISQPPAQTTAPLLPASLPATPVHPTSFANGRYQVNRFLGEGGKKKVYLAHDTLLDREVAFALIKTDGLDEAGRSRIQREAQAMGRLGPIPTSCRPSTCASSRTSPTWSPSCWVAGMWKVSSRKPPTPGAPGTGNRYRPRDVPGAGVRIVLATT